MTRKILLFIFLISFMAQGQNASRKSFKYTLLNYPIAPITGAKTFSLKIHTGSLGASESQLKGRKAGKRINEKVQGGEYFLYKNLTLVGTGADIQVEVALGKLTQTGKKLKTQNIPCKQIGAALTKENVKECPVFYYGITYELPAVVRISDKSGKLLYAKKVKAKGYTTYGYNKSGMSGYMLQSELDENYAKSGKSSLKKNVLRAKVAHSYNVIRNSLFFSKVTDQFEIGSGKGKKHDYAGLDKIAGEVIAAFKSKDKNKITAGFFLS